MFCLFILLNIFLYFYVVHFPFEVQTLSGVLEPLVASGGTASSVTSSLRKFKHLEDVPVLSVLIEVMWFYRNIRYITWSECTCTHTHTHTHLPPSRQQGRGAFVCGSTFLRCSASLRETERTQLGHGKPLVARKPVFYCAVNLWPLWPNLGSLFVCALENTPTPACRITVWSLLWNHTHSLRQSLHQFIGNSLL